MASGGERIMSVRVTDWKCTSSVLGSMVVVRVFVIPKVCRPLFLLSILFVRQAGEIIIPIGL